MKRLLLQISCLRKPQVIALEVTRWSSCSLKFSFLELTLLSLFLYNFYITIKFTKYSICPELRWNLTQNVVNHKKKKNTCERTFYIHMFSFFLSENMPCVSGYFVELNVLRFTPRVPHAYVYHSACHLKLQLSHWISLTRIKGVGHVFNAKSQNFTLTMTGS